MDVESLTMYKPWSELSISEKSEMMKAAIRNGITNLNDIKEKYNEFAKGGDTEETYEGGTLPEIEVTPNNVTLFTYRPIIDANYKWTGHSALASPAKTFIEDPNWRGIKIGIDAISINHSPSQKNYNLVTNNCSDATRRALETISGKKINQFLFTTPGDVKDFAEQELGGITHYKNGRYETLIPISQAEREILANKNWYRPDGKIHIKPENRKRFTALKERYNEFAEGGDLPPYSAGKIADALWSSPNQEYLGEPSHHYDFTQSEDWANAHGYYPDNRGHRDDRVKKSSHPSHPSKGNWSEDGNIFNLTDVGMRDPNYIFFGLADGDQDPQASLMYKDTTVLPEITVTPNGNYYLNPYDNYKLSFAVGGPIVVNKPGDKVSTDQCAKWSNSLLRNNGYLISGNAWNLKDADMLYNGFNNLDKPNEYNIEEIKKYNHAAAENVYNNFDSNTLDKTKPYVVNMFYNDSPAQYDAYKVGKNVTGTHTGVLTYDNDKKKWFVTHNIHGTIYQEPFVQLQSGKGKYGVTAVYAPREDTKWNRIRSMFGFANGGIINKFTEGGPKNRRSNISEILSRMMASKSDVDLKKDNIQSYEEGINSAINSSADNYTVQKGDTLASIAEKITGSKQNYAELAKYNNIDNPDFIQIGQKLKIPEKYNKPLDISEIPTKNRIHIIDDYSPRFNYVVEDDKVYYSQKGKNNYWVDISDNSKARKNLLEHLAKKGFAGYDDNEQYILNKINNNTFDYSRYHDSISNTDNKDIDKYITNSNIQKNNNKLGLINDELKEDFNYTVPRDATNSVINPLSIKTSDSKETDLLKYLGNTSSSSVSDNAKISKNANNIFNLIEERPNFPLPLASDYNTNDIQLQDSRPISYTQEEPNWFSKLATGVSDFYQLGKNYLERQFQKRINDNDPVSTLKLPDSQSIESSYGIIPQTYTGDTIQVNGRRYILPESIDLNNIKLGVRNRGEEKPLSSEGAIITNFNEYKPASSYSGNGTYMGIDKDGNFKVGDLSAFNSDDLITRTYANKVTSFATDSKGNQKWKDDAAHGNSGRSVPIVNVQNEDGSTTEGSINILTSKNKKDDNTYGNITGGRVVMEAGNERRLVSGSIADIKSQFEDMKKRHNADYVTFYTLDNGSYNRGLRTKDKNLTSEDLHMYDRQNSGGGNFMYIVDNKGYNSETLPTPNIRTESDESYKKGHPLVNEKKGIVLHHTAFMEPDLTNVINHLRNPKSEASSHVVIGYNGERKVLADPDAVTFHAGSSVWNNRDNVNDFMLGIEFQGDTNKKDLTDAQIDSAIEYMLPIIRENNIPLENIVTHQQVRDMYNEFAKKQKQKQAPSKPDINFANYEKIINRLKNRVYYKKAFGGPIVQMANKFDGTTQPTQQMDSRPAFPWIEMARQEEQAYQNAMQEPYFQVNGRISKDEWRERNKPRDPGQITQSKYPSGPVGLGQMIDEYVREAKYRANNGELMLHGKYGLPLAGLAAGAGAAAGSVLPTILANPYVDAGLTSAFAAHGLNHTLNEGIDGWGDAAMTALEITPLGRVAKPMWDAGKEGLQYAAKELASDKLKWLYNEGDIFNASMKYNPNNFYREISKEAIDDAINSGVIRSGSTERYIGPFFGKGYTPWQREKYIIEGYPEKNDWIYANPYENAVYVMQDEPEVGKALMKEAFKKIPKNSNVGAEAFPYSNGSINSTPTTNFDYWKKYPLLGWRKNKFNVTETPQITAENAASITPEQWTAAQDAAIARGDMAEAQRLRDLHSNMAAQKEGFSAYNTYHGQAFKDITYRSRGRNPYSDDRVRSGYFSVPSIDVASTYNRENGAPVFSLYTYLRKPFIADAKGNSWQQVPIYNLKGKVFRTTTTDKLANQAFSNGLDGVIVKNVDDIANGSNLSRRLAITDDYISKSGRNKLRDAVTYDDNGVRIPLGKRDNFKLSDIRYGLIPLAIGLSAYGLYNENQTNMPYYLSK